MSADEPTRADTFRELSEQAQRDADVIHDWARHVRALASAERAGADLEQATNDLTDVMRRNIQERSE
jgi:hypothetical protein